MHRIVRLVRAGAFGAAALVVLAVAPMAGATHLEPGMTVSIADAARLVNGVYLVVPISVTCPTIVLGSNEFIQNESVVVGVSQKSSKVVTGGSGQISYYTDGQNGGQTYGTPLTCDGSPHDYVVNVFPESSGQFPVTPFKGGKAVASVYFSIFIRDPYSYYGGDSNNVSVGPVSISIKG